MPRTREFDPDQAIEKAVMVFWKKGYFDTSVEDLVRQTGVSRYGLYGEFGNKKELFHKVLRRYGKNLRKHLYGDVSRADAGLSEIESCFRRIAERATGPHRRLGCLLCNTATELAPHEKETTEMVRLELNSLRKTFFHALQNARRRNELKPGPDAKQLADFLTGVVMSLALLARSGAEPKMIRNLAKTAMTALRD
jgi:TetR/AcrR family transcriptional repressor of nem operon